MTTLAELYASFNQLSGELPSLIGNWRVPLEKDFKLFLDKKNMNSLPD